MKPNYTPEQFSKLPIWVQQEIRRLEMRLKEKTDELNRINDNPPSNTIIGFGHQRNDEPIKYLQNDERITFKLENGDISARITNKGLEIHGNSADDLIIKPSVSNCVFVRFTKLD